MQNYQYHSQYLTKRAATLLQESPKPESVDDFTYRRLAHVEFHPVVKELNYIWLWSAADEGYLILPTATRGARGESKWSLVSQAEWEHLQTMLMGFLDATPPEALRGVQPVGWGCVTDVLIDFKMRADAAREPDKRH